MTARRPTDTLAFLEYAHSLGAAGIQMNLTSTDAAYIRKLRDTAERHSMYVETMAPLPSGDTATFERHVSAAIDAGAVAIRVGCLSGRRYENFSSYDDWKSWVEKAQDSVFRAVSVVEKRRIPMALENHKDWTAAELASLMKRISSEYAGVCLDTGNNISLLDDPYEVVETLAPYTLATHVKDMGLARSPDGFLLSEVVWGKGVLDMKRIVGAIAAARPRTKLTLEMITRNPLSVPCLTTKYWATFPDRSGAVLARMFTFLRQHESGPLPSVDGLTRDQLIEREELNVKQCLAAHA